MILDVRRFLCKRVYVLCLLGRYITWDMPKTKTLKRERKRFKQAYGKKTGEHEDMEEIVETQRFVQTQW